MGEPGIRAEVAVRAPDSCPIAEVSGTAGADSRSISRSVGSPGDRAVTEEFSMASEVSVDRSDVERVFSYGSRDVYRFTRERGSGCPCETVERHDCPVVDVHARDGTLTMVFHAPDMDRLRAVVDDVKGRFDDVKGRFDDVSVRRLLRSSDDRGESELVFVDRGTLTDRQREVLETANEMGYFEHPKGANAGEVAEALGITASTFTEHLSAAQSKLFEAILDDWARRRTGSRHARTRRVRLPDRPAHSRPRPAAVVRRDR